MTERVLWSSPATGAKATVRETLDGMVVTTTADSMEGAVEADAFLRMLREHFGLPDEAES